MVPWENVTSLISRIQCREKNKFSSLKYYSTRNLNSAITRALGMIFARENEEKNRFVDVY